MVLLVDTNITLLNVLSIVCGISPVNKIADLESRLLASSFFLKSITIYPIKSCAGFSTESWPLSISGITIWRL